MHSTPPDMWTFNVTSGSTLEPPVPGDDQSLLQRYRRGDDDAATELYMRYAHRLQALTNAQTSNDLKQRVDNEDLVQSIFRTFFRRVARGQYDVPDGEELWKLLLVIGLNKIRSTAIHHRAHKRDIGRTSSGDAALEVQKIQTNQSDETGLLTLEMTIDELLSQLPPQYREIVNHRIAGYDVAEIAEMTKRSKRTVERILQAFRNQLGDLLKEDAGLEPE
ncbi:MAG: sigma-70 family RNA polymerase sigma factor [Pirellulaceae bacterium]|nr:sigma-70 family RNA polymerase sigma factor [Pirellulaceae bacterium]